MPNRLLKLANIVWGTNFRDESGVQAGMNVVDKDACRDFHKVSVHSQLLECK